MTKNTSRIPCIMQPIALILIAAFTNHGQAQVQLSGRLSDQASGAPIAGLAITLLKPPSGSSPQPQVFRATTRGDGSYSLGVPAGAYRICAEEVQGFLDPCQWRLGSTDFVVSAMAVQSVQNVALLKGRELTIRVLDYTGSLKVASAAGVSAPAVSASVVDSSGKSHLIPFRKTTGSVHVFSLLVPLALHTLHVSSPVATLAAPDGKALTAAGYTATVDTAVAPASLPSWLPMWLSGGSSQGGTIVVLGTSATSLP
jgi:hypothetical protein